MDLREIQIENKLLWNEVNRLKGGAGVNPRLNGICKNCHRPITHQKTNIKNRANHIIGSRKQNSNSASIEKTYLASPPCGC
jgi:hypothetical protein